MSTWQIVVQCFGYAFMAAVAAGIVFGTASGINQWLTWKARARDARAWREHLHQQ